MTKELCEVIEDYSLVNFTTLDIQVCLHELVFENQQSCALCLDLTVIWSLHLAG